VSVEFNQFSYVAPHTPLLSIGYITYVAAAADNAVLG